jgi:hypothetical protein
MLVSSLTFLAVASALFESCPEACWKDCWTGKVSIDPDTGKTSTGYLPDFASGSAKLTGAGFMGGGVCTHFCSPKNKDPDADGKMYCGDTVGAKTGQVDGLYWPFNRKGDNPVNGYFYSYKADKKKLEEATKEFWHADGAVDCTACTCHLPTPKQDDDCLKSALEEANKDQIVHGLSNMLAIGSSPLGIVVVAGVMIVAALIARVKAHAAGPRGTAVPLDDGLLPPEGALEGGEELEHAPLKTEAD